MNSESIDRWAENQVGRALEKIPRDELLVGPTGEIDDLANFDIRPPGSKSITNRALICAALADGTTELSGVLYADDTIAMIDCLLALGVTVEPGPNSDSLRIEGMGRRPIADEVTLNARLSGTTARFIAPAAALLARKVRLDGGPPLRARPMGELVNAMRSLGASVESDRLPLTISGGGMVGGPLTVRADVSSQFLSALLLSAPLMEQGLDVGVDGTMVSEPYVQMTIAVMESFAARVDRISPGRIVVATDGYRSPSVFEIEPDASAASYFLAAAAVCGGRARIIGLDRSSLQGDLRLVDILDEMGLYVVWGDGWVEVRSTGDLHGIEVDMADCSDVAQTLAVVATQADGPTRITGIGFIRAKETDRVRAMVTELQRLGIDATEEEDGILVRPGTPRPGLVRTYDDHRMAMSFAVLGLKFPGIRIADPHCVAKTYPGFWQDLGQVT